MHLYKKIPWKMLGAASAGIFLAYIILTPHTYRSLGDVFFGRVPTLYNVNLAQFLYTYAAYPLIGTSAPFAHYQLSRTYFIQGSFERSLEEVYKEIEKYPEHYRSFYILGLTLGFMDREEEAIEAFQRFIDHEPMSWAARNDKAWLQFRIGDIDGALETIRPVTADTVNPWVQNTYGTLLYNKGEYASAREAFLRAEATAARMTEAHWGRAYPGNDPRVYGTGLNAMRESIRRNLELLEEAESKAQSS